jgi:hypothetical protein
MGATGIAALDEPSSAPLNPAIVGFIVGVRGYFLVSSYSLAPVDHVRTDGLVGIGGETGVGRSWEFGGGVTLGHTRDDYESHASQTRAHQRTEFLFIGAHAGFASIVQLGIGATVKWYPVPLLAGGHETARLLDIGALVSSQLYESPRDVINARAGYSYYNMGDAISDPSLGSLDVPEARRWGIQVDMSTFRWRPLYFLHNNQAPGVAISASFDTESEVSQHASGQHSVGGEIGLSSILFARGGYVESIDGTDLADATWGLGIGVRIGTFGGRLDITRWPARHDEYTTMFGFSLSVPL